MKYILLAAILALSGIVGVALAEPAAHGPFDSDLKINELASLPQGLTVVHTPEAVEDKTVGPTGTKWIHSTTVTSTVGPVTILEFGCLSQQGGQWQFATVTKAPYTASNFAQWYACPDAKLQPSETYTDESNFSLGSGMPGQDTKWYFIGVDAQGNRAKGEANVTLLSEDGC